MTTNDNLFPLFAMHLSHCCKAVEIPILRTSSLDFAQGDSSAQAKLEMPIADGNGTGGMPQSLQIKNHQPGPMGSIPKHYIIKIYPANNYLIC